MRAITEEIAECSEEIFEIWKRSLIQFAAVDRHILHDLNEISKSVPLAGLLDLKNPYRPLKSTDVKKDKAKEAPLNQSQEYQYYRKNLFIQNVLAYPLLYPQLFNDLKNLANDKETLANEIEKRAGLLVPEIEDTIGILVSYLGSIDDTGYEANLEKALVDAGDITSYQSSLVGKKVDDPNHLEKLGLQPVYDDLHQYINDEGVDVRCLEVIERIWRTIFTSTKSELDVIEYVASNILTIESHFERIKPKPKEQKDFDIITKDIIQYVTKISGDRLTEIQELTNITDERNLLNFLRGIKSKKDTAISQNDLDLLHLVFLFATKDKSIAEFYERIFSRLTPQEKKKRVLLDPTDAAHKKKIQALLPNKLIEESEQSLDSDSFIQKVKRKQEDLEDIHIMIKTPGRLKESKQRLREKWMRRLEY